MTATVRPATPADCAAIAEFSRRLALETEGKHLDPAVVMPGVAAALADPAKGLYFLAEVAGEVVGQVMITYEWSDWRNGWVWWFQSVYVRADARRQGVFRALYAHVYREAKARGVIGLRLYVEENNQRGQATYRGVGMVPAGYLVYERCPLDETP